MSKERQIESAIAEVVKILEPLGENDKRQALALLQGMVIGKELAAPKQPIFKEV